jgi:hypothetical protein
MAKRTRDRSKSRFKGAVTRNASKQSRGAHFAHLNIPKGVGIFREEPKSRITLDILPYEVTDPNHPDRDEEYGIATPGTLWYKRPYWVHRGIGPNNEMVICLASFRQPCPICEHRAQMLRDGADWNDDAVRALKNSMRNLYVVVPRGSKNYDEVPHIWDISQFLFQDKLNEEVQENEEYEAFPDPDEGFSLQIRFSESQLGTNKFAETSRIDFKDREPLSDELLDAVPHLDELLDCPTREAIEALFFGGVAQDEIKDEDEEEWPTRHKQARGQEDSPWDEDEDEEEDFPVDDEDEEEEPLPPPKRRGRRVTPVELEPEEEEEEEEEPAPPKSRARGRKKGTGSQCPHGHAFGADCDEHDECAECEMWEKCADAADAA